MAAPGGQAAGAEGAPSQEEVQQALMLGENLRNQLQALDEQESYLEEMMSDAERGREALQALKDLPEGEELLLPIGAGNFVRARISGGGKVLTGLGSGVHMEAGVATALERLEERVETLRNSRTRLQQDAERVAAEMARVNAILQQAQGVQ